MWLRILVALILFALLAPILIIILMSFTSVSYFGFPPPGFSLKWYMNIFENEQWISSMLRSLYVALLTTIVSTIIGTIAANGAHKLHFKGKGLFMAIMIAPMIIPVIVVGIALYNSFSSLGLLATLPGLVLAHSIIAIPVVFISVLASLKGVNPNLERAAQNLGSPPVEAFFKVTMPIIKPAILSSALFSFIISFDELVITFFLAGPTTKTLPVKMWEDLRTQIEPTIAAISAILIVGVVLIFILQEWSSNRSKRKKGISVD